QRIVERELGRVGLAPRNIVIELGHPEPLKRAARDGLGLLLINRYSVVEELKTGVLREVSLQGPQFEIPVFLVYRRGRTLSPLQTDLRDFLRDQIPLALYPAPAATAR